MTNTEADNTGVHPSDQLMKVESFGALESAACSLCGSEETELVVVQHWYAEDFSVVRCNCCAMIRTNPRPTPEWKSNFYNPECNGLAEKIARKLNMGREFVFAPAPDRLPSYKRLLEFLMKRVPAGGKLIDIGASSGIFTKMATDAGFDATACDYSADALAYGEENYQIPTLQSPAERVATEDQSFDIVTILHTIEHLPDPLAVLKELNRILKPGGTILLETPNYLPHYLMQTKFRFIWPLYKWLTKREHGLPWVPFDHYYHWTPKHLRHALELAGFENVQSEHMLGYRSNTKPNFIFWCAYTGYDCFAQLVHLLSFGKLDLRLVLLASGTKPK